MRPRGPADGVRRGTSPPHGRFQPGAVSCACPGGRPGIAAGGQTQAIPVPECVRGRRLPVAALAAAAP